MALSPEEQQAVAYIKERRKHRARTGGQVVGASAGVLSGQGTMDAELAKRNPYSGLSSAMQKQAQMLPIVELMAADELETYEMALDERSDRLKLNVEAMMKNRQISSTAKQASARLRLQGEIAAADRLDDQIESAMGLSPAVDAYIRKSAKMGNKKAAAVGGGTFSIENLKKGKGGSEKSLVAGAGGTPVPGTSGYNENRGDVEAGAEMLETELLWLNDNPNASVREKRLHINNIEAISAVTGIDPGEKARGDLRDPPRGTNIRGVTLEQLYAKVSDEVTNLTASEFEESDEIQVMLKRAGSGGATSEEDHAASMDEQVREVYGEDWDPEKPLPGFGIVPESKARTNYMAMIETINAQPEEPLVVSMKAEIQDSDYYNEWKTKMGYDDGADDNMVWREWSQKAKQLEKAGRKKYRDQRRQNIDDGLSKARGPGGLPQEKKALPATETAKLLGDKKPEDVALETT